MHCRIGFVDNRHLSPHYGRRRVEEYAHVIRQVYQRHSITLRPQHQHSQEGQENCVVIFN